MEDEDFWSGFSIDVSRKMSVSSMEDRCREGNPRLVLDDLLCMLPLDDLSCRLALDDV